MLKITTSLSFYYGGNYCVKVKCITEIEELIVNWKKVKIRKTDLLRQQKEMNKSLKIQFISCLGLLSTDWNISI